MPITYQKYNPSLESQYGIEAVFNNMYITKES